MLTRMKFIKISKAISDALVDQLSKLIKDGKMVDLYFSLEKHILEGLQFAYDEGYKAGKAEVLQAVNQFEDKSKDVKPPGDN